ncbi:MAG: AAC(3) family N-acetyltransferase [Oscillospiraceae bacterium]|nr:AAC(3) family N-acetyltransferase [Oscillospiraceae bacterium]
MADLNRLNIDPGGTLMVHFSYKEIGEVEGRADAVLDALAEYMSPGLLVLPTHTWLNVNLQNPVMDVLYTPTCVGTLPELFRLRPNVCRSLHPTHSLAALGKDAPRLISGEEYIDTPCGYGGVYYKLWERDAQILLVGVNFARNTFIHGIEDWDHAVGSLSEEKTDLYVINADGYRLHTPQYRHDSRLGSETFTKLEPDAIRQGIMTLGKLGMATTRLMRARPLREMVADILKSDPGYLTRH